MELCRYPVALLSAEPHTTLTGGLGVSSTVAAGHKRLQGASGAGSTCVRAVLLVDVAGVGISVLPVVCGMIVCWVVCGEEGVCVSVFRESGLGVRVCSGSYRPGGRSCCPAF